MILSDLAAQHKSSTFQPSIIIETNDEKIDPPEETTFEKTDPSVEEIGLSIETIDLLMSHGRILRDVVPCCYPILSIDTTFISRSSKTDYSLISCDIQDFAIFVHPYGIAATSSITSSLQMSERLTNKPSITRNVVSLFRPSHQSHHRTSPVLSSVPIENTEITPSLLQSPSSKPKRHLKMSPSVMEREKEREMLQRTRLDRTQLAVGRIVNRGLQPPTLPSLKYSTTASTNQTLRCGWLFMKFPRTAVMDNVQPISPRQSPRKSPRRPKRTAGWAVWVEVVHLEPSVDRPKRGNRHRRSSGPSCNALWVFESDPVFDSRPLMIIHPNSIPVECSGGFTFSTERYACLSSTMLHQVLLRTGDDIPPVGRKGHPIQFQFNVPPTANPISFDCGPPSQMGSPNFGQRQLQMTPRQHRNLSSPYLRTTEPLLGGGSYWCRSLSLDVSGFRLPHMIPPDVLPRRGLTEHSGSRLQLFARRIDITVGENRSPLVRLATSGVAFSYQSTVMSGNNLAVVCDDISIESLTVPVSSRQRYLLSRDSTYKNPLERGEKVTISRSSSRRFSNEIPNERNNKCDDRLLSKRYSNERHMKWSRSVSSRSSYDHQRISDRHQSPDPQTPLIQKGHLGSYWLPTKLTDFVFSRKGGTGRRHFLVDCSMDFDNETSWIKIDPVQVVLQPEIVSELCRAILSLWIEFLHTLPRRSPPARKKSSTVGFSVGGVFRAGPLPAVVQLPPLLPKKAKADAALEAFAVSISILLSQSYTGQFHL